MTSNIGSFSDGSIFRNVEETVVQVGELKDKNFRNFDIGYQYP